MVRTATPFPMVSLLFVFTAFVISNIGHIRPQRTILAFVSGIFFILSGGTYVYIRHIHKPVVVLAVIDGPVCLPCPRVSPGATAAVTDDYF